MTLEQQNQNTQSAASTERMPVRVRATHAVPTGGNKFILFSLLTIILYSSCMYPAYAGNTPMGEVLCTILDWITGNLGRGLATIAVAILGVGAMLGKSSWGLALTVGIGIVVVFNGGNIVMLMGIPVAACP